MVAFTETCGHELAAYGIRASVVCPSYFRTNLMDSMQGSDELVGQVVGGLVERSRVTADDIAAAVLAGHGRRRGRDRARRGRTPGLPPQVGRPARPTTRSCATRRPKLPGAAEGAS